MQLTDLGPILAGDYFRVGAVLIQDCLWVCLEAKLNVSLTCLVRRPSLWLLSGSALFPVRYRSPRYCIIDRGQLGIQVVLLCPSQKSRFGQTFRCNEKRFSLFLATWTLQATWVVVTTAPVLTVIATESVTNSNCRNVRFVGVDHRFLDRDNCGRAKEVVQIVCESFICTGLWSGQDIPTTSAKLCCGVDWRSPHCLHRMDSSCRLSPAVCLDSFDEISGVPMLEAKADHGVTNLLTLITSRHRQAGTTPKVIIRLRVLSPTHPLTPTGV